LLLLVRIPPCGTARLSGYEIIIIALLMIVNTNIKINSNFCAHLKNKKFYTYKKCRGMSEVTYAELKMWSGKSRMMAN
jgi:hypothetical protein